MLILSTFSKLLFLQLSVAALFFLLDLFTLGSHLLRFTHAQKFDVLLLERLVHATFILLEFFALLFLSKLLVKFIADQSAAFLFAKHGLLLLFVVQKSVELLNGSPFVFFTELRVDVGSGSNARCHRHLIGCAL